MKHLFKDEKFSNHTRFLQAESLVSLHKASINGYACD